MTPEAAVLFVSALGALDPRNDRPLRDTTQALQPAVVLPEAPPPPPPYSVPWQLRPVVAPNVVRLDTSFASYQEAHGNGLTTASVLTGAWRIPDTGPPSAGLSPTVRLPFVRDVDAAQQDRFAIGNPLVGIGYAM